MFLTEFQEISGAIPPPPGVQPNFEHPDSIRYRIIIASVVCWAAATAVLFLRLHTRRNVIRIMATEDYILFVGWILSLVHSAVIIAWVKEGAGIHFWDLPVTMLDPFVHMDIAEPVFYGASTLCIKISILLFFFHLSPYRRFRVVIYIISGLTIVYCLISILQFSFSWNPVTKIRDLGISSGSCAGPLPVCVAIAGINMGTDVLLLLLPIAMVWNIRFTGNERAGVVLIFTLGSSVCIASIVRFTVQVVQYNNSDDSWIKGVFLPINTFEINFGIICACLPHLKALVRRLTPCNILKRSQEVSRATDIPPDSRPPQESVSLSTLP